MRRKTLNSNANSMHTIMENFRRYQGVLTEQFGDHDDKIYLFENNNPVPTTVPVDEFVQRIATKQLTEHQAVQQWTKSWDYEVAELNRLYEQHALLEQEEEEAASELSRAEEFEQELPMWLKALGKMVNKAFDTITAALKRSLALVVWAFSKAMGLLRRFKEKAPMVYKFVFYGGLVAIGIGILYFIWKWTERALSDAQHQPGVPLCTQAIAGGDIALQEAEGRCIVGGQVLNKKTYEMAHQSLTDMIEKGKYSAEDIERIKAGREALTKCYEAAQDGKTVSLGGMMDSIQSADRFIGKAKAARSAVDAEQIDAAPDAVKVASWATKKIRDDQADIARYKQEINPSILSMPIQAKVEKLEGLQARYSESAQEGVQELENLGSAASDARSDMRGDDAMAAINALSGLRGRNPAQHLDKLIKLQDDGLEQLQGVELNNLSRSDIADLIDALEAGS